MSKLHIKKGDIVFVNAGEDKGKTGRVLEVLVSLMQRILKEVLKRRKLLFIFLT